MEGGAPNITAVSTNGKNLVVSGTNFDGSATILVDNDPQRTLFGGPGVLVGKKTAKRIASGQTVSVQVQNGDSALSQAVSFTKP